MLGVLEFEKTTGRELPLLPGEAIAYWIVYWVSDPGSLVRFPIQAKPLSFTTLSLVLDPEALTQLQLDEYKQKVYL